jgi:hypothetical protein
LALGLVTYVPQLVVVPQPKNPVAAAVGAP